MNMLEVWKQHPKYPAQMQTGAGNGESETVTNMLEIWKQHPKSLAQMQTGCWTLATRTQL